MFRRTQPSPTNRSTFERVVASPLIKTALRILLAAALVTGKVLADDDVVPLDPNVHGEPVFVFFSSWWVYLKSFFS